MNRSLILSVFGLSALTSSRAAYAVDVDVQLTVDNAYAIYKNGGPKNLQRNLGQGDGAAFMNESG